jgi:hypothetical protein
MYRKLLTAVLIAVAIATSVAAVPGLAESVAYACNRPSCD